MAAAVISSVRLRVVASSVGQSVTIATQKAFGKSYGEIAELMKPLW